MFVDCSGQKPIDLEAFPFPTLVSDGTVRKARARFADPAKVAGLGDDERKHLVSDAEEPALYTGGIDVDAAYRVVGSNGAACLRIYNIAFPHTSGVRPYSYGLQACSATSAIMVQAWISGNAGAAEATVEPGKLAEVSTVYHEIL